MRFDVSMITLVTEDQFDIEEKSVVHRPNARFLAYLEGRRVTSRIDGVQAPCCPTVMISTAAMLPGVALKRLATRPSLFR
jgi:hypothetical protein